jgi:heat shock protein HslJ/membrane-bound inhibitor of C-type lysozyme
MATSRSTRLAPLTLALIAALAATACQQDRAEAGAAAADVSAPETTAMSTPEDASVPSAPAAPVTYSCGGTSVQAAFDGDNATVLIDGESIPLSTVPAASGARYQGARADGVAVELWTKDSGATLSVAGNAYPECTRATPAEDAASPVTSEAAYRARGNEPFWSIETIGDTLRWATPDTPEAVVWGGVTRTDRADGFDLSASRDGSTLTLAATATLCRDSMSGMPYPHTVSVRAGEQDVRGCGGEARELLAANAWTVSSVEGTASGERPPTLEFMLDGGAAGFSGCNRWMSPATLTGEGLTFERAASTMMACPEEDMKVEQAFLGALAKVTRHDFDEAGNLLLKAGDDTVIVASAVKPEMPPPG